MECRMLTSDVKCSYFTPFFYANQWATHNDLCPHLSSYTVAVSRRVQRLFPHAKMFTVVVRTFSS